jgi:HAD superfamily hydrolase (TIGR01509 family)
MSATQLRGVIFDMDGVLVDSHAVHREAWRRLFQTLGREVSEGELDFVLDGGKRLDILRHFLGDRPVSELEEFGRRKGCIFRQMQLKIAPVPGVVRLIEELHDSGIAVALATSASRRRAGSTLVALGLANCFCVIVTGDDVSAGKPDAAVYRMAVNQMGIETQCLLAFEDAISGVRAATGANLRCIGVALHESPGNLTAAGAIHVVSDFKFVSAEVLENISLRCDSRLQSAAASAGA